MLHRNPNKRILPDILIAPGGKLEPNEGVIEASKREVFEETKIEITNIAVKAVGIARLESLQEEVCIHIVTADYISGELKTSNSDGMFEWYSLTEILAHPKLLAEMKTIAPLVLDPNQPFISYKVTYDKNNQLTDLVIEQ